MVGMLRRDSGAPHGGDPTSSGSRQMMSFADSNPISSTEDQRKETFLLLETN